MPKPTDKITWSQFSGVADSLFSGVRGSFYKMVGLDSRSQPGSITAQQKLTKDSGSTVDSLCQVKVEVSDGSYLFFSSTSGKIWRTTGNGTYTLVNTTVPSTGNAGCLGAAEYNGNIYWATQNYLHKVATANISNFSGKTENWQAFTVGNATYHPMVVQISQLYIGDANQIAKVDSTGTFTEGGTVYNILAPNVITTLAAYDQDIVIGTIISTAANYCWIQRWDGTQTVSTFSEPVREAGIYCLMWDGNTLLANCGVYGKIYQYDGRYLQPYTRIPGTWSPTATANILPNAWGMVNGNLVFGLSQVSGNPADFAVWGLGSYSANYAKALSEDFPISTGNFTNIQIGCIAGDGLNLYVAWSDSSSTVFGIDKLDWSNKYGSGYLETTRVSPDWNGLFSVPRMFAAYQSMPASCSLTFKYYSNNGNVTTPTNSVVDESTNHVHAYVDEGINNIRVIRVRLEFNVSGNNAPVVEALGTTIS